MSTVAATRPDLATALATAASLIATAALVRAAGAAAVRVVIADTDIDVQVPPRAGDQAAREQAVAVYAEILGVAVTRRHSRLGSEAWIEAHGGIGGHDVHVWTVTDPSQEP
jgi:hypothetical protein